MVSQVSKKNILIIVLVILLLVALGYIGYSYYDQKQLTKQTIILQQGAQIGYQQAVLQLYSEAIKCNSVPVTIQNQTINLIAIECLQQSLNQQQQIQANS